MNYLDIHAHILPDIDDGAKDLQTATQLLLLLKEQGVTDVIATPHFYPDTDNAEEFAELLKKAYIQLTKETFGTDLPRVFIGCELRYFNGMGKSRAVKQFVIKGTNRLLIELPYGMPITKATIKDITDTSEVLGLFPILAHIERYSKVPGFKNLLKLISDGYAQAHINASAVVSKEEAKICEKLIKGGYVSYLASDTHSPKHRPPQIKQALEKIEERLGKSAANRLRINSNKLLEQLEAAYEQQ